MTAFPIKSAPLKANATGLHIGDTIGVLRRETLDGTSFIGTDSSRFVD